MREAEIAVVQHTATADQSRRVEAMAAVHTRTDRRRVWMELDEARAADTSDDEAVSGREDRLPRPRPGGRLSWYRAGPHRS
jgi:hypothetical protein